MNNARVYSSHRDVRARLNDLDLTTEVLHSAIRVGEHFRRTCTAHDPAILPGFLTWSKTTRALRDELVPTGWSSERVDKLEAVVRRDRRVAIVVVTGDSMTGMLDLDLAPGKRGREPKSKYPKGPATLRAVVRNRNAPTFDFAMSTPRPDRAGIVTYTWLLLVCVDQEEIRCELSLPRTIDEENFVDSWHERIVLPALPRDIGPTLRDVVDDDDEDDGGIDVEVRRIG